MAEEVQPQQIDPIELIAQMTTVLERMMAMSEIVLELVKITSERIEAVERFQQGLSFEDMVDGKVPPIGMTTEQRERLVKLQEELSERLPHLPSGI